MMLDEGVKGICFGTHKIYRVEWLRKSGTHARMAMEVMITIFFSEPPPPIEGQDLVTHWKGFIQSASTAPPGLG